MVVRVMMMMMLTFLVQELDRGVFEIKGLVGMG